MRVALGGSSQPPLVGIGSASWISVDFLAHAAISGFAQHTPLSITKAATMFRSITGTKGTVTTPTPRLTNPRRNLH